MAATLDSTPGKSSARRAVIATAAVAAALAAVAWGQGSTAELAVVNPASAYPEGPLLDGDGLLYAEMGNDRLMRWDGVANREVWSGTGCGPTSVARWKGGLLVLCHANNRLVTISRSGETLGETERDAAGRPFVNPNASVNDARGGVYFSSSGLFGPNEAAAGAVLYLDPDGTLSRVAGGIRYANGVALSPDGARLFVSEHLARRVLAYDVGADGGLSGQRVQISLDDLVGSDSERSWEVGPDGLAVDQAGNLYVAEYGGGRLLIASPGGELLATVPIPEAYVTAPALSADETVIFITAPVSLHSPGAAGKVYSVANPIASAD